MIEVSSCVICDGPIRQNQVRFRSLPFLAERTWGRKPFCVDLVGCDACGFMFYNPRLDEQDLRNLYRDFRSEETKRHDSLLSLGTPKASTKRWHP